MKQLHKSKNNRMLFGVCGGLSDSIGIDATLIRVGFLLGAIFTGSVLFWVYLVLALLLPTQD